MASVISVVAKLKADTNSYIAGMNAARKATENFTQAAKDGSTATEKQVKGKFDSMGQSAIRLGTIVKAAVAGFVMIQGKQFLQGAIQAASTFEAEFEGVNQTFGEGAVKVQEFAKNAAQTAGLAENTALRFAKSFGGYAKSAGLAGDAQADFANQMVQAAGDLGSFFDLPTEQALMAIQQGLRGEYEPLRRFNILLDEATIGQKAMAMGISETGKDLTQQQKVMVRQQAIMEQMGVAQGDFVKYADTYGNSIKTTAALMDNMKQQVGSALLPSLAKLSTAFQPVIETLGPVLSSAVEGLLPLINALTGVMGSLVPVLQPVIALISTLSESFAGALSKVLPQLMSTLATILPPVVEIIGRLFELFMDVVIQALPPLLSLVEMLAPVFLQVVGALIPLIQKVLPVLVKLIVTLLPIIQMLLNVFVDFFLPIIIQLSGAILDGLVMALNFLLDLIAPLARAIGDFYDRYLKPLVDGLLKLLGIKTIGIDITMNYKASGIDTTTAAGIKAASQASGLLGAGGASASTTTPTVTQPKPQGGGKGGAKKNPVKDFYSKMAQDAKQQQARLKLITMGLNEELAQQVVSAGEGWDKIYKGLVKGGTKAIDNLESKWAQTAAGMAKIGDIVKTTMEGIQKSIMDGFDVTKLGSSGKAIISNARLLVQKAKAFGAEITQLAAKGLNPTLLNQVIAAGPEAGLALAKSLNGADISELNSLYNQLGQTAMDVGGQVATSNVTYNIQVSGGVGDKNTIGKSIVDAIKAYERQSGTAWRTA